MQNDHSSVGVRCSLMPKGVEHIILPGQRLNIISSLFVDAERR